MILEVKNINTFYGTNHILFDLSLAVVKGEGVCLLGRNGAGKTTTLRSILGLTPPNSGSIIFHGQDITRKPPYEISKLGIGWVPEDRKIFPDLTTRENLMLAARSRDNGIWNLDTIYNLFPKLKELDTRKGGHLSGGEQQMLTVARTLMTNPEVLLLDEPGEGLAPLVVAALRDQLIEVKKRGVAMLICEHLVGLGLRISDRVYVIDKGVIQYQGTIDELSHNDEVKRRYLML